MSDISLMNPEHLQKEIADLQGMLSETKALANEVHTDIDRIFDLIQDSHHDGQPTTLSYAQVNDLIEVLAHVDANRWRYFQDIEFTLRIYKLLQKDRRWLIGSKLSFLKKK